LNENWVRAAWLGLGYKPNPTQAEILLNVRDSGNRFFLICGGERAGKSITSVASLFMMLDPGVEGEFVYWIVGPDYAQARAEFSYIHKTFAALGMIDKVSMPETKTQPWILHAATSKWKATFETRTSSDITKLASFTVHGVLMVEAAQQSNDVWLKLRGRVAETRGFIVLSGTLENGLPWYADMMERWAAPNTEGGASFSLPTWSNTAVFPRGLNDPEMQALKRTYPPDLFDERFGAKPRRKRGLVIPEFDFKKNVKELTFDETKPVELFIDPAQHTYAVWFAQQQGQYTCVFDKVYEHGLTVFQIITMAKKSIYWPYVAGGVIDVAGTQQHANKSQVQLWRERAGVELRFRKWHEEVLINTVRAHIGGYANTESVADELVPLCYFDKSLMTGVSPDGLAIEPLSEFALWRWPRQTENSSSPRTPIDKNNDAIKALGYGLLDWYGPYTKKTTTRTIHKAKYWV